VERLLRVGLPRQGGEAGQRTGGSGRRLRLEEERDGRRGQIVVLRASVLLAVLLLPGSAGAGGGHRVEQRTREGGPLARPRGGVLALLQVREREGRQLARSRDEPALALSLCELLHVRGDLDGVGERLRRRARRGLH